MKLFFSEQMPAPCTTGMKSSSSAVTITSSIRLVSSGREDLSIRLYDWEMHLPRRTLKQTLLDLKASRRKTSVREECARAPRESLHCVSCLYTSLDLFPALLLGQPRDLLKCWTLFAASLRRLSREHASVLTLRGETLGKAAITEVGASHHLGALLKPVRKGILVL
jgi:hypothetical protein